MEIAILATTAQTTTASRLPIKRVMRLRLFQHRPDERKSFFRLLNRTALWPLLREMPFRPTQNDIFAERRNATRRIDVTEINPWGRPENPGYNRAAELVCSAYRGRLR